MTATLNRSTVWPSTSWMHSGRSKAIKPIHNKTMFMGVCTKLDIEQIATGLRYTLASLFIALERCIRFIKKEEHNGVFIINTTFSSHTANRFSSTSAADACAKCWSVYTWFFSHSIFFSVFVCVSLCRISRLTAVCVRDADHFFVDRWSFLMRRTFMGLSHFDWQNEGQIENRLFLFWIQTF